jgi:YegS/Rv2252/BmrU family lipid kinase
MIARILTGGWMTNDVVGIVNPAAGKGRAEQVWRRVERELRAAGVNTRTAVTRRPGDAALLTRQALDAGHSTVAAVGGDGTVHEVVNGLFDGTGIAPGARLAIVPAGTGMDFARNIGAKRGVRAAVERILASREQCVDVGVVPAAGRVFVNFMETGLGAAVVAREAQLSDSWPGRASFFVAALGAAVREDNMRVHVRVAGQSVYRGPAVSVVVANGRYFAGGMKIAPMARMDDGALDVLILGDFRRLELASQIWKIYPGVHVKHDKVMHVRGPSAEVETAGASLLDLDGELGGNGSCTVHLLPNALRVLA